MVKLFTAFITVAIVTGCFAVSGTEVAERPVTLVREPITTTTLATAPTTTVYEYGPNLIRQYFIAPELPEWTEQRYRAVTISAPSEIEAAICSYDWNCEDAKKIAFCESSNRVNIVSKPNSNGTRDHGLFQINDGAWKQAFYNRWDQVLELEMNVKLAHEIWKLYGWSPWVCKKVLGAS